MPSTMTGLETWNPSYIVSIFGTDETGATIGSDLGRNFGILSPIPEEFSLETGSTWHALLEGLLHTIAGSFRLLRGITDAITNAAGAAGYSLTTRSQTQQIWQSTSPIAFNLPLRFNAVSDVVKDVSNPILQLLALTLPSAGVDNTATFLQAPGPTLLDSSLYKVNIAIGTMFLFTDVIVKNVRTNFTTLPADSGDFVYADVDLTIETSRILTKGDFKKAYVGGGRSPGNNLEATVPTAPNNSGAVPPATEDPTQVPPGGNAAPGLGARALRGINAANIIPNISGQPNNRSTSRSTSDVIPAANTTGTSGLGTTAVVAYDNIPTATQETINPPSETVAAPINSVSNPSLDIYGRILPNQNALTDTQAPGLPTITNILSDNTTLQILNNADGSTTQISTDLNGNVTTRHFNIKGVLIPDAVVESPPGTPAAPAQIANPPNFTPVITYSTDTNGYTTTTTVLTNPDGTRTITAANISGSTSVTYAAHDNTIIIPAVTIPSTIIKNTDNSITYIGPDGTKSLAVTNADGSSTITVTLPNSTDSVTTPLLINEQTAANPRANLAASTTNQHIVDLPKTTILNNADGSKTMTQTTLAGTTTTIINANGSYGNPVFKAASQIKAGNIYSNDPNTQDWLKNQVIVRGLMPIVLTTAQQQQLNIAGQTTLTTTQQQTCAVNDSLIAAQLINDNNLKLQGLPPTAVPNKVSLILGR